MLLEHTEDFATCFCFLSKLTEPPPFLWFVLYDPFKVIHLPDLAGGAK